MMTAEVTGKVNGVTVTLKGTTEDGAVSFLAIPVFINCENMIFQSEIAITCLKTRISQYIYWYQQFNKNDYYFFFIVMYFDPH